MASNPTPPAVWLCRCALAIALAVPCGGAGAQPFAPADAATTPTVIQLDVESLMRGSTGAFAYDPQTRPPFDIVPPLSVYESRLMLRDARQALAGLDPAAPEAYSAGATRADFMLLSVARYIHWVDQSHTTLPYYSWRPIGDIKLDSPRDAVHVLRPTNATPGATAIALRAHNGDVRIEQIAIVDDEGRQWQFNRPFTLRADTPRSETRFLPLPLSLREIRIRCAVEEPNASPRPRIFVESGVGARPESAKQAVFRLLRARGALRSRAPAAEAIAEIEAAERLLLEYQRDRRL